MLVGVVVGVGGGSCTITCPLNCGAVPKKNGLSPTESNVYVNVPPGGKVAEKATLRGRPALVRKVAVRVMVGNLPLPAGFIGVAVRAVALGVPRSDPLLPAEPFWMRGRNSEALLLCSLCVTAVALYHVTCEPTVTVRTVGTKPASVMVI